MAVISPELVLDHLRRLNPWWSGSIIQDTPFRRIAFGVCLERLLDMRNRRAVLLSGPRRVGKSTILQQVAGELLGRGVDPNRVLYATLDDNILKLAGLDEVLRIYREQVWSRQGPAYLLLDEIQYAPGWELTLKVMIDHDHEFRILATGSSALDSSDALTHAGVGRWETVPIPTLSFYEYLHLIERAPSGIDAALRPSVLCQLSPSERHSLVSTMERVLPDFREYLLVGGFPETAQYRDNLARAQRLLREDIVDRVLKRDIAAVFNIRNVVDLEKLFLYLCLHSGSIVNASQCASALEIDRTTLNNYLDVLVRANLLYRLPQTQTCGKKQLKQRYKYYLVDAALRNAILLSSDSVLSDPTESGLIVETAVLRHLRAFYYADTPEIGYWRGDRDEEVDIVVSSPSYRIAAEVKYRENLRDSDLAGLKAIWAKDPRTRLFLITKRPDALSIPQTQHEGPPITHVPAHIFTYLVGQAERSNH